MQHLRGVRAGVLFCFSVCALAACDRGTSSEAVGTAEPLLAADRAFAAAAAERGLSGWIEWFASDAVRILPGSEPVRGPDAIAELDADLFADPDVELFWEPEHAGFLGGGESFGFTTGAYRLLDASGTTLSTGRYLTLWAHTPDGWRVALDAGLAEAHD